MVKHISLASHQTLSIGGFKVHHGTFKAGLVAATRISIGRGPKGQLLVATSGFKLPHGLAVSLFVDFVVHLPSGKLA